jgi:hypothetical protein
MIVSTTLQSRTSRTKKKLSDNDFLWRIIFLALGVFLLMTAASFSAALAPRRFGVVSVRLPVSKQVESPLTSGEKVPTEEIDSKTPLVVLSETQFVLGDINAFTKTFSDVSNKVAINHQKGAPHLGQLVKLLNQRFKSNGQKVLVLLPTQNIPMSIVIQSIAVLKAQTPFQSVILANGLW